MAEHLRIDDLAEQAAAVLSTTGTTPASARVSPVPDRRMLRYYAALGLLDRPLEVRGRTAYYGRRHLLQVVAVKRLQAAGASLAEVQRRLAGVSDQELERIADLHNPGVPGPVTPDRPRARTREGFWKSRPRDRAEPAAVRLGPGVTLVFDAARPVTADDRAVLEEVAAAVVDQLATRGLLAPAKEPQP